MVLEVKLPLTLETRCAIPKFFSFHRPALASVQVVPQSATVAEGQPATFQCNVNPVSVEASFSWTRADGQPLPTERLLTTASERVLTINRLQQSDSGVYTCTAEANGIIRKAESTLKGKKSIFSRLIVVFS